MPFLNAKTFEPGAVNQRNTMTPIEKIRDIAATARYEPDPRKSIAELAAALDNLLTKGPVETVPEPEPEPATPAKGA